jgi:hypothetical protein
MMRPSTSTRFAPFVIYVCAFHATWVAWPYLLYPRLIAGNNDATLIERF